MNEIIKKMNTGNKIAGIMLIITGCTNQVDTESKNVHLKTEEPKEIIIKDSTGKAEEIDEEYIFTAPEFASEYQPRDKGFPVFGRERIAAGLKSKVEKGEVLTVHMFVPLCDNKYQGIVPTSPSIGDGFKPNSNLYWATSNGIRRYFKEKKEWEFLKLIKNVYKDSVVLERVVFRRSYAGGATVYLVADAYRGDKMYDTVNDFFRAMSDNYRETLKLDSINIEIHGAADMVVFNGHNGLLDLYEKQPDRWYNEKGSKKDMVTICCYGNEYFEREAMRARAYPIVRAKSLLHPGAFVISAIIDQWAMMNDVESMRLAAGKAYCKAHGCSEKTSRNLFYKGWRPKNLLRVYE
jgi:hypothetical protein